jgi:hypothetical protein
MPVDGTVQHESLTNVEIEVEGKIFLGLKIIRLEMDVVAGSKRYMGIGIAINGGVQYHPAMHVAVSRQIGPTAT